jgi:hypothetical protein
MHVTLRTKRKQSKPARRRVLPDTTQTFLEDVEAMTGVPLETVVKVALGLQIRAMGVGRRSREKRQ